MNISTELIETEHNYFLSTSGKMVIYQTPKGAYILDDTYTHNQPSFELLVRTLTVLVDLKPGILVAGDIPGLDEAAAGRHEDIGRLAVRAGINRLYLSGKFASSVIRGARYAGMKGGEIFLGTNENIAEHLEPLLGSGDWVLIKGCRSDGMEKVVARLADKSHIHVLAESPLL